MNNNSDFEQQFTQNLNATAAPVAPVKTSADGSKLPLVVAIALAAVTLVETIVLIITLTNYFSLVNGDQYAADDSNVVFEEDASIYENYAYDADDNLKAFKATCVADNGATYTFDLSNNYTLTGSSDSASSGTYTVTNDSLVSLSGSNKILYFDGITVADGLTIYDCEKNTGSDVE